MIHKGKMDQILLMHICKLYLSPFSKETVIARMMLNKNIKAMVYSFDGDKDFFNIVAGVLRKGTSVPYLFILCQDYILQTSIDLIKENGFTLKNQEVDDIYDRHRLRR